MDILSNLKALLHRKAKVEVPDQRRRLTRVRCSYPAAFRLGSRSFKTTVVDIGLDGMRLEVPKRIPIGTSIAVKYEVPGKDHTYEVDTVPARVLWCRKKRMVSAIEAGVLYEIEPRDLARSWVRHLLAEMGFDLDQFMDLRTAIRVKALLPGEMTAVGHGTVEGTIANLSTGGVLFESTSQLPVGTGVHLQIGPWNPPEALECAGRVIHTMEIPETNRWLMSVCFENLTSRQVDVLSDCFRFLLGESRED